MSTPEPRLAELFECVRAWPLGESEAPLCGHLRADPDDFVVEERLRHDPLITPAPDPKHCWVWIEKVGANTEWVGRELARQAGVAARDVGWAGLKDRHARTRQWFSVPGADASRCRSLETLAGEGWRVLAVAPQARKLRQGAGVGNRFWITLRDVALRVDSRAPALDPSGARVDPIDGVLTRVAARLRTHGALNLFGPQRFGHGLGNLPRALALFAGRSRPRPHQRGLYLSAARAFLFNQIAAARHSADTWLIPWPGEPLQLDGSHSVFVFDGLDPGVGPRVTAGDLHPTGPLVGRGDSLASGLAEAGEADALAAFDDVVAGLHAGGVDAARRALRVNVQGLAITRPDPTSITLDFQLDAGAYATVILGALIGLTWLAGDD